MNYPPAVASYLRLRTANDHTNKAPLPGAPRETAMKRHLGQKIAFAFAILCYLAAIGCAVTAFLLPGDGDVPIRGAFMASVVFFVGCGIVLHVIGTARLKGLLSDKPDSAG